MSNLTNAQRKNLETIRDELNSKPQIDAGALTGYVRDSLNVLLTGNREGKYEDEESARAAAHK